nr:hypothetical protein [Tanacetum cinerariifolium]
WWPAAVEQPVGVLGGPDHADPGSEDQARSRGDRRYRGDLRRFDLLHADRGQFLRSVHHLHLDAGGADHGVGRDLRGRPDSSSLLFGQGPDGRVATQRLL